ncbi:MAG: hypothetical protein WDN24_19405 [Sphingomonas sp.]
MAFGIEDRRRYGSGAALPLCAALLSCAAAFAAHGQNAPAQAAAGNAEKVRVSGIAAPAAPLSALNPQPLPPKESTKLKALNPQPLPPKANIKLNALNPQPLPPK